MSERTQPAPVAPTDQEATAGELDVWPVGGGRYAWLASMPGAIPSRALGLPVNSSSMAEARGRLWLQAAGGPEAMAGSQPAVRRHIQAARAGSKWSPKVLAPRPQ